MATLNKHLNKGAGSDTGAEPYTAGFYDTIRAGARRSAQIVVPMVLKLIRANSVVDVGCGDGTWLAVFRELGVQDTLGLDGDYVDRQLLQIPPDQFIPSNLSRPFKVGRSFDLAVSLEVAEHLPAESAEGFVLSLTQLAPVVFFSAAIPFQGGTKHVNEQWPDYWTNLFGSRGYLAIDCIRMNIWDDENVEFWYRQNCLIFARSSFIASHDALRTAYEATNAHALRLVHPQRYLAMAEPRSQFGVREAYGILTKSLRAAFRRRLMHE
jgi:SAM-dependent methyltransferase